MTYTIQLPTLRRDVSSIEGEIGVDAANRTIKGTFASERPVERIDWFEWVTFDEVVSSKAEHWDLERVNSNVCPFLDNHWASSQVGLVTKVWFENGFGHFEAKISRCELGDQILRDSQDGIFGGLSYGYRVLEYEEISPPEYEGEGKNKVKIKNQVLRAIKVVLYEISRAPIPADPGVSLQRSHTDTPLEARIIFSAERSQRTQGQQSNGLKNNIKKAIIETINQEQEGGVLSMSENKQEFSQKEEQLRTQLNETQDQLIQAQSQLNESQNQLKTLATQLEQRDAQVAQLEEKLGQMTRKQEVSDRYNQVRRKAEELVTEAKITGAEFNDIFGENADEDIERLLKSAPELATGELSSLEFYISKASKRSAMLNTQSVVGDEPIQQRTQELASPQVKTYGDNLDLKSVDDDKRIRSKAKELGLDPNKADDYATAMIEAGITY